MNKLLFGIFALFAMFSFAACKKNSNDTPAPDTGKGSITVVIDGKENKFEGTPSDSPRFNFFRKSGDKGVLIERYGQDKDSYVRVEFMYDLDKGGFPKEMSDGKAVKYHDHTDKSNYVSQPQDVTIKVDSYKDKVITGSYSANLKEETNGKKISISGKFTAKLEEL
jgi:hypothetical protein